MTYNKPTAAEYLAEEVAVIRTKLEEIQRLLDELENQLQLLDAAPPP